jgi:hypothetical protein
VAQFVRLDEESRAAVEAFLTRATGAPARLGRVWLAPGLLGRYVTWVARAAAVTLGPVVFLRRGTLPGCRTALEASGGGRPHLDRLGALLVHECVHVWQYRRTGTVRFLAKYVYSYCTNIAVLSRRTVRRRVTWPRRIDEAYRRIPYEVEAFEIEKRWLQERSAIERIDCK